MEAVSEVLLRNRQALGSGAMFLVNPARDHLAVELDKTSAGIEVFTQDYGHHEWFQRLGMHCDFGVAPSVPQHTETVVLRLAREKERFEMLLHAVADSMPPGARLWVVGEKRAGIQSAPKRISRYFSTVRKLDSARHCMLFEGTGPLSGKPFSIEGQFRSWTAQCSGQTLKIRSLPGVFAHGRLDKGTALLLEVANGIDFTGDVLDFACGAGVIGACLKAKDPAVSVTCLDISATALAATRETFLCNGMEVNPLASDGLTGLDSKYDWIVSNPPFHLGVRDDLDIAADFFRRAGTFLNEKGKILVVFNRHLPYVGWIKEYFDHVEFLAKNREFCVVQATKQ